MSRSVHSFNGLEDSILSVLCYHASWLPIYVILSSDFALRFLINHSIFTVLLSRHSIVRFPLLDLPQNSTFKNFNDDSVAVLSPHLSYDRHWSSFLDILANARELARIKTCWYRNDGTQEIPARLLLRRTLCFFCWSSQGYIVHSTSRKTAGSMADAFGYSRMSLIP